VLADGQPSTDPGAKMYANGPSFGAVGVELEYKAQLGPVSSFGTYTYLHGLRGDVAADAAYYNFDYVPRHKIALGVSVASGRAFGSLAGVYVSSMRGPVPDATGSTVIGAQVDLDVTLGYDDRVLGFAIHHALTVKNVADQDSVYPEYVDLVLKDIPWGQTRRVLYTASVDF
jgi:hypothetical protein